MQAPPREPATRPDLRRPARDRVIAGVAAALAERFGLSVALVRAGFLLCGMAFSFGVLRAFGTGYARSSGSYEIGDRLALLGATGVFVYGLIWFVVPRDDQARSPARRLAAQVPGVPAWLGVVLFVLGASLLGTQIGLWRGDAIWSFLLITLGVLLFRRDAERRATAAVTYAAADAGAAERGPSIAADAPDAVVAASEEPVRRTPRERSPLGWIAFGIMLLTVGGTAIVASLGVVHPTLQQYPALAMLVLALGLLVGTLVGRAKWLILPALVVTPALLLASLIHVPLEGGFHGRYVRPSIASARTVRSIVGDISIDVTRFRGQHVTVPITASTGFGSISVTVPYDAHVIARASSGLGDLWLFDAPSDNGVDATGVTRSDPRFGDGPRIVLRLAVGIGNIWLSREWLSKKQRRHLDIPAKAPL